MKKSDIAKDTDELKKLIWRNLDLPIIVLAGEDATGSDSYYTYCSRVRFEISEVLCNDDVLDYNDCLFTDREDFEENRRDFLCTDNEHITDEKFDKLVEVEMAKYEDDWVKAIIIYADN